MVNNKYKEGKILKGGETDNQIIPNFYIYQLESIVYIYDYRLMPWHKVG